MKYLYLLLGLIFISFAVVQYNDPDPYIWAPYYLVIALICFFRYKDKGPTWLVKAMLGLTVAWAASYIPDVFSWWKEGMPSIASSMKAESPYIENMREFLGLVVSLLTLIPVYLHQKRTKK